MMTSFGKVDLAHRSREARVLMPGDSGGTPQRSIRGFWNAHKKDPPTSPERKAERAAAEARQRKIAQEKALAAENLGKRAGISRLEEAQGRWSSDLRFHLETGFSVVHPGSGPGALFTSHTVRDGVSQVLQTGWMFH